MGGRRWEIRLGFRPVLLGLRGDGPESGDEGRARLRKPCHVAAGRASVCRKGYQPRPKSPGRRAVTCDARIEIERLGVVPLTERVGRAPLVLRAHENDAERKPCRITPGDDRRALAGPPTRSPCTTRWMSRRSRTRSPGPGSPGSRVRPSKSTLRPSERFCGAATRAGERNRPVLRIGRWAGCPRAKTPWPRGGI